METITQTERPEATVLLQCEIPVSLMRRVRIAAAHRNPPSRAIRPVVVEALDAHVPQYADDSDTPTRPSASAKKRRAS